ncbi:hypothetical protein Salat_1920100 [Sesamum alatum]|uniref:Uncharacterized protein n=1 Tax=Sesamum alatum TaxID=300844 RepID=A0AAE1Y597_9LAMI|nr:hypothetical protein Salat_1920100 [Sesamum alatum]
MNFPIEFSIFSADFLLMRNTGSPIACTQMWIFMRSTSSRASSGSHGFETTRFPRDDHGLWRQMRSRLASLSRRNTRMFWSIMFIWVFGGIFQALERVVFMALLFWGLSERTLTTRGNLSYCFGSCVFGFSSSENSSWRVLLKSWSAGSKSSI